MCEASSLPELLRVPARFLQISRDCLPWAVSRHQAADWMGWKGTAAQIRVMSLAKVAARHSPAGAQGPSI